MQSVTKKRDRFVLIGTILAVIAGPVLLYFLWVSPTENPIVFQNTDIDLNNFTKCLTESGAQFFGTVTCPYCQKQKELFGPYFSNINFVDCIEADLLCNENMIEAYPTWIIDGKQYQGLHTLQELSKLTGCILS